MPLSGSELMYNAFSSCIIMGNVIKFLSTFSKEEHMEIYSRFSGDLLDYKIPHYRVVGIRYPTDFVNTSVIRTHRAFGMSPIELATACSSIVPIKLGGNKNNGSFVPMDDPTVPPEDSQGRYNILARGATEIGQLMYMGGYFSDVENCDPRYRLPGLDGMNISTKTLVYKQLSFAEAAMGERPQFLVERDCLATVSDIHMRKETTLFYEYGTGIMDYGENALLFAPNSGVLPCRTVYDLSLFFTCKFPVDGDDTSSLILQYRDNVNEYGLQEILHQYAEVVYGS